MIQLSLGGESPAWDLQHLSAAIDRAASTTPAPDLIALPGQCDTGGAPPAHAIADAVLACARENLASKAREWGVFIAAGLHVRVSGQLVPYAILLDSDGDTVARSGGAFPAAAAISLWSSQQGTLGVLEPTCFCPEQAAAAELEHGALVVLPMSAATNRPSQRALDEILTCLCDGTSAGGEVHAAVVSPAAKADESTDEPLTLLRGPGGKTLAYVNKSSEATAVAQIVLERTDAR